MNFFGFIMLQKHRFLILWLGLFFGYCFPGTGQDKTIEKLNQHFHPISTEDSLNFTYLKMNSVTKDSVQLERIFDQKNRIIKVTKTKMNQEGEFTEKSTQNYDPFGNLLSQKIVNLDNGKFIETFFYDGQQVGQVLAEGNQNFMIIRSGEQEPTLNFVNDFEPQFTESLQTWNTYLLNHLSIDRKKVTNPNQKVIIGILVDKEGIVKKVEWANPQGAEPYVAERAISTVKGWGRNFLPALDAFGNPIEKWLYIPIRYKAH
ncbi:hypothetical protein SAMN04488104_1001128 [Algoriphagus faecimaris]|uniref:TonB protein C-terminal n=1 Tax=Algoriphagus faecimaris TaxID=686796 RepID=A0A1G6MCZ2_9BACT|nr:hypothetical protein [Algoriphagus faecimaris]SDC53468.1 hypothetical protein SAMN04488104_1001128 [Algoriphagus faecimaris]